MILHDLVLGRLNRVQQLFISLSYQFESALLLLLPFFDLVDLFCQAFLLLVDIKSAHLVYLLLQISLCRFDKLQLLSDLLVHFLFGLN